MTLLPPARRNRKLSTAVAMLLVCAAAGAQTGNQPAPATAAAAPAASAGKPAPYSGCVLQSPADKAVLVISTDNVCARLTGKLATPALIGHQIDLKGVLTPRTAGVAAAIQVEAVSHIGKACSDVCALQPPGKRGLGEKPGKEGGTPGLVPTTPPAP